VVLAAGAGSGHKCWHGWWRCADDALGRGGGIRALDDVSVGEEGTGMGPGVVGGYASPVGLSERLY